MERLAFILAICLASAAQPLPTGRAVLSRVAKSYRAVRGFHLQADVVTQMIGATGGPMNSHPRSDTIVVDYRAPEFFSVEHGNPRVTEVLPGPLPDPYHPKFEDPPPYPPRQDDGRIPESLPSDRPPFLKQRANRLASLGFADYTAVEYGLTRAKTLRQERLELEGSAVACWVVDASYSDHTRRTFWVDSARGIVLREVRGSAAEVSMSKTALTEDMEVERTMTVKQVRWDETGRVTPATIPTDFLPQRARNGVTPAVPTGLNGSSGMPTHSQCYEPGYTEQARIAGLSGTVMMDFTIDKQGRPTDIHPENVLGLGLDEMAAACLSRWRYAPARKDGQPIAVRSKATMNFNQRPHSDWRLVRVVFRATGGATPPVFLKADYPQSDSGPFASVLLHLIVAENGVARDLQPNKTADPKLAKKAMAIVSRWRFTPGERDGRPTSVEADFELVHDASR